MCKFITVYVDKFAAGSVCVCEFECIVVSTYIVSVSVQVCVCVIVNVDCVGAQQGADSAASAE